MKFPTPAELAHYYVDPQRFFGTEGGPLPTFQAGLDPGEEPPTVRVSNWYLLDPTGELVLGEITAVVDRDSVFEIQARLLGDYLLEIKYQVASMKRIRIGCRAADHLVGDHPSPLFAVGELVAIPQSPILQKTEKEQLLLDAIEAVTGPRQDSYGDPEDSLGAIAAFWSAYLVSKGYRDVQLDAVDAGMMMLLLKFARESNKRERDNRVDIAGYIGIVSQVCSKYE